MITWEGFTAGLIAALVIYALARAALWVANSRTIADSMDAAHGDWPHRDGRS